MSEEARRQPWLRKTEIVIAVIGLIGVIATGVLSNWEKIFAKGEVLTATYEGYSPTGNFETEFRYFFEVSGNRAMSEQLQEQIDEKHGELFKTNLELSQKTPILQDFVFETCLK